MNYGKARLHQEGVCPDKKNRGQMVHVIVPVQVQHHTYATVLRDVEAEENNGLKMPGLQHGIFPTQTCLW